MNFRSMKIFGKDFMRTVTKDKPIFSLCHTTARLPNGWREAVQAWKDKADHPELVEHILTTDDKIEIEPIFENTVYAVNEGPRTAVAGWNLAAKLSTGKFLISLADDWFPCEHWDTELLKVIPDLDKPCVLDVNTGGNDHLLTFSLLTRAYYETINIHPETQEPQLFWHEYTGMYADNDFTDKARLDRVVVNARKLLFLHKHPAYTPGMEPDEIHKWQGRPEAYKIGVKVYRHRCHERGIRIRPRIAVCMPGEHFSSAWVANWTTLQNMLTRQYDLIPIFAYSSNVYVTRACMAEQLKSMIPEPDVVLWFDDDQIFTYEHFKMLADSLDHNPTCDAVTGWSWVQPDVYGINSDKAMVSVGMKGEKGECQLMNYARLMEGDKDVKEIHFTGFPGMLMRYSLLEKAGDRPFSPIIDENFLWGFAGEDTSFCIRARRGGGKILVDRRVKIPHLKLRAAEPFGHEVEVDAPVKEPVTDTKPQTKSDVVEKSQEPSPQTEEVAVMSS